MTDRDKIACTTNDPCNHDHTCESHQTFADAKKQAGLEALAAAAEHVLIDHRAIGEDDACSCGFVFWEGRTWKQHIQSLTLPQALAATEGDTK